MGGEDLAKEQLAPHFLRTAGMCAWVVLLVGMLLWPLAQPGALLHRDMAVLAHPALSPAAVGFGDLPARNAPQDGVLALSGYAVPAEWVARLLLLASALFGAWGAVRITRHVAASTWASVLVVALTVVNPFVVERLLQGQWSLVIAAWLLPGVALWAMTNEMRLLLPALWLCSITPTGCVVAVAVALVLTHRRVIVAGYGLLLALPWLVPSLLSPSSASATGATAFAVRAESPFGLAASVVGLGGIWNDAAVPNARAGLATLASALLFFLLLTAWRRIPRCVLVLAGSALVLVLILSFFPMLSVWLVTTVPGAAMFRDTHKLLLFALPAYVFLAANLRPRTVAAIALGLSLFGVWDTPHAVGVLRPSPEPQLGHLVAQADDRDVFVPTASAVVPHRADVVVNPLSKAVSLVESGALSVDGVVVDPPSARHQAAVNCWKTRDLDCLRSLNIGMVATPTEIIDLGGRPHHDWRWWLGCTLTCAWLLLGSAGLFFQQRRKFCAR
ncbi:hypothetical protein [Corynebacterium epidermidicanis]|uniref:Transmembrane protein n=1 Tax=Corynebacterium epidermidicanis TaxID=1050174 RepID=A0A0G3GZA0_9CORY|nr:hypothetical protein [Corynebacterium epidermidicanis]AKK04127.1 hypothetical protein CEPID_11495 [Corynebacterium epidermidicanis]